MLWGILIEVEGREKDYINWGIISIYKERTNLLKLLVLRHTIDDFNSLGSIKIENSKSLESF